MHRVLGNICKTLALCFALGGPASAQEGYAFFMGQTAEWHQQLVLQGLTPPIQPENPVIFDEFVAQYAPGFGLRQDYAELRAQAARNGIGLPRIELYDCGELIMCSRTVPSGLANLPDGEPFFAHHHAALLAAQDRYNTGTHGPPDAHVAALQELINLIEVHTRLQSLVLAGQVYDPFDAAEIAELNELLAQRFLAPAAVPEPALSLLAFFDEQETRAVEVPAQAIRQGLNDRRSTIAFVISLDNDSPPQAIRLELRSDHIEDIQVLGLECDGGQIILCERLWSNETMSVQVTLGPDDFSETDFILSSALEVGLFYRTDQLEWSEADRFVWSVPFAQCEAQLQRELDVHVDAQSVVEALQAASQPVADLPGARLYPHSSAMQDHELSIDLPDATDDPGAPDPGPQDPGLPIIFDTNALIASRLQDETLASIWAAGDTTITGPVYGAGAALTCEPGQLAAVLGPLEYVRGEIGKLRERYHAQHAQAVEITNTWQAGVRAALREFDEGREFVESDAEFGSELMSWYQGTAAGELFDLLIKSTHSAQAGEAVAARVNLVGAIMVTWQALSAAGDLMNLRQEVQPQVREAQAWLETETYLGLMVDRLDHMDRVLSDHIDAVTEAHRDACICLQ